MVVETKKIINSELQPEIAASYILDKFYDKVIKKIKEKETINHKYFKIASTAVTIILAIVFAYPSFINNKATSTFVTNQPNSATLSHKSKVSKEDVEKYLKVKGVIPLISEEPMPEEEIKFVKEKVTGKISSVTMNLSLDCTSIKVKTIDKKGNIKVEATISPKISAKGWEIAKGTLFDLNENKTLKENYKDGLNGEILAIYQSKESVISTYNEIKKRAENVAKEKINDLLKNQYPDIDETDVGSNYQTIDLDISGTDLK
jgi:primosomal protein N'